MGHIGAIHYYSKSASPQPISDQADRHESHDTESHDMLRLPDRNQQQWTGLADLMSYQSIRLDQDESQFEVEWFSTGLQDHFKRGHRHNYLDHD